MSTRITLPPTARAIQLWLAPTFLLTAWFAAQAIHELGHVLHAFASGATIQSVKLPLLGFSQTTLLSNPHPLFVVIGGPLWGVLAPCLLHFGIYRTGSPRAYLTQAFAAFCLVLNGAYLAFGWIDRIGDTSVLIALGAPTWSLAITGAAMLAGGLWLLHRLGPLTRFGILASRPDTRAAVTLTAILLLWCLLHLTIAI